MKPNHYPTPFEFLQIVSVAMSQLKQQLQKEYQQAYPELRDIVHLVLAEEEKKAWELTPFPHLLLPDLVDAHITKLNLQPPRSRHDDVLIHHPFNRSPVYQPELALCAS